MTTIENILLVGAVLLLLSVISSKLSNRFGIPSLLLFLAVGMLAGSEGLGGIYFDDPFIAQSIGVVALAFILFSGGFDTDWEQIRPVLWAGAALSTLGVILSAALTGLFIMLVFGMPLLESLLFASIMSSTDAAAVFAVLRARGISLPARLRTVIELEAGSNDPMAVILTTSIITLMSRPDASVLSFIPTLVLQLVLGVGLGYVLGRAAIWLLNSLRLQSEGLYPVVTVGVVMLVYGGTSLLGGNGFLAVYVAGLLLGNSNLVHKRTLMRFHDGLAWLMQIAMFLVLGLLVFPSRLVPVAGPSLLVAAFLILVARPVAVMLVLLPADISFRGKLLVAWIGLRGAVPIILATFPLLAGVEGADAIFNVVFFVVLTSVLVQGPLIPYVTKWLGLQAPGVVNPYPTRVFLPEVSTESRVIELSILPESRLAGRNVMDLNLPVGALIVLVNRGSTPIVPSGATTLEVGDELLILADPRALDEIQARFDVAFANNGELDSQTAG